VDVKAGGDQRYDVFIKRMHFAVTGRNNLLFNNRKGRWDPSLGMEVAKLNQSYRWDNQFGGRVLYSSVGRGREPRIVIHIPGDGMSVEHINH
jgi:hypothetical protein